MRYPITIERDTNGTLLVLVPDVPGAHTFACTRAEAKARALDAMETIFIGLIADGKPLPKPSAAKRGQATVTLSALSEAKWKLYEAMRRAKVGKAELSKRLGWPPAHVDRLLDFRRASPLDRIEAAFAAFGKQLVIEVTNAA